jgi:hypothetical protein
METQTHYYFVNLLIADLIQAIGECQQSVTPVRMLNADQGEICNIKWVAEAVGCSPRHRELLLYLLSRKSPKATSAQCKVIPPCLHLTLVDFWS